MILCVYVFVCINNGKLKKALREVFGPCQRFKKKTVVNVGDGDTICNKRVWNGPQRL